MPKTLRIEGLALEMDYDGGDAMDQAHRALARVNTALDKLEGDMALMLHGTLIAMVREDTDDKTDPGRV